MGKCVLCASALQADDYSYLLSLHIRAGGMTLHDATHLLLSGEVTCKKCNELSCSGIYSRSLSVEKGTAGTFSVDKLAV